MPFSGPQTYAPIYIGAVYVLSNWAVVAAIFKLIDGAFASKQLIAGCIAETVFFALAWFLTQSVQTLSLRRLELTNDEVLIEPLVPLVRWYQLSSGLFQQSFEADEAKDPKDIALLKHLANDAFCPCCQCLRNLPRKIFWERIFRSSAILIWSTLYFASMGWTAMVRYASTFWTQWWGVVIGVVFFASNLMLTVPHWTEKWHQAGAAEVSHVTRLYHRATYLALQSFLERAKEDLWSPPTLHVPDDKPGLELFIKLHDAYMTRWISHNFGTGTVFLVLAATFLPVCLLAALVINLVRPGVFG